MNMADEPAVLMGQAVDYCLNHVRAGGLPFVGVIFNDKGVLSEFGVNQVRETGDSSAHAEIVAMRDAMRTHNLCDLSATTLIATGEPCGLCYRFAFEHFVEKVYVAVDRDEVAQWGFDYLGSYTEMGITDDQRNKIMRPLLVPDRLSPFEQYCRMSNISTP